MEKFLNKMERKFGRFAVRNLMKYIVILYAVGAVIALIPGGVSFFYSYLSLDFEAIFHGQIWRLFTFLIPLRSVNGLGDILLLVIEIYFYFAIGNDLENVWGTFRFNVYYFSGIILQIVAAIILYVFTGLGFTGWFFGLSYLNEALFLAFCVLFPDALVRLMFVIPVKVKWLGIFYALIIGKNIVVSIISGEWYVAIAIIAAIANFIVFYLSTRNLKRFNPREIRRKQNFKQQTAEPKKISRHKCAVCGRTEETNPELEFRFCSKCNGNYEYCQDHLFSHTHVQ